MTGHQPLLPNQEIPGKGNSVQEDASHECQAVSVEQDTPLRAVHILESI